MVVNDRTRLVYGGEAKPRVIRAKPWKQGGAKLRV
jgi:hypothetical protein